MKILPLNNHILVSPIGRPDFVEGMSAYDEMGIVLEVGMGINELEIGETVYFDSFLIAKYPGDTPETPVWLVKYEDIRAKQIPDATEIPTE